MWLVVPRDRGVTLAHIGIPSFSSTRCLGSGTLNLGPKVRFTAEWETDDELVGVLNNLIRQGWQPINHMDSSIELLPAQQTTVDLWMLRARLLRAVSLSYTDDLSTRLVASTSIVLCLP